ncbi:MAG: hypothetical protein AAFQ19_15095 [Pseudomonadota bacterium]
MSNPQTNLVTTVTYDTAGTQGWTSIAHTHDPLGFLVAKVTTMDNGSTQSETFFGPQRLSLTVTDTAANNANWASRTTEWDWQGNRTARTTVEDDGDIRTENYDATTGQRIARIDIDHSDSQSWFSKSTFFDPTGKIKIGTEKVDDNGRIDTITFDVGTGARSSRTITDGGDTQNWHSISMQFDVQTGKKTEQTKLFDDQSSETLEWSNGKLATRTEVDGTADSFDWVSRETVYDHKGKVAQVTLHQDDTDLIVQSYAGGTLIDQTTYDNSGNAAWHVQEITYDGAGNVTDTQYFDETGNVLFL